MAVIIVSSFCIMIVMFIMSSRTCGPSDFMELDSIVSIVLRAVESHMREIVPDREEGSIHEIRQEEFIEHEDDSERNDRILMAHHIAVEP